MSTNDPSGYGYPSDPQQNPYGQQPYGAAPQPPYGQPQSTQPWPAWLGAPIPGGGAPAPGTRSLASAADRFVARLIDFGVLLIPTILLYTIVAATSSILYYVLAAVLYFGYEIAMLLTQNQQTIGKKVMKLRVVSLSTGGRPTDNELWTRAAIFALPQAVYCLGSLFALLNILWHLWDKPFQQCLHDKPAKTVVVKEG
jgi:uncharacterized RDD family membrane protein YckC